MVDSLELSIEFCIQISGCNLLDQSEGKFPTFCRCSVDSVIQFLIDWKQEANYHQSGSCKESVHWTHSIINRRLTGNDKLQIFHGFSSDLRCDIGLNGAEHDPFQLKCSYPWVDGFICPLEAKEIDLGPSLFSLSVSQQRVSTSISPIVYNARYPRPHSTCQPRGRIGRHSLS